MKDMHKYLPIIIAAVILILLAILIFFRKRPKALKVSYYEKKWAELQQLCADKATWADAIINADKLLDEALKRKKYGGKSMGERLVSAQRDFTDNDTLWFGHKLRNKISVEPTFKLKQKDVKEALIGIKRALKDLGAFKK